MSLQNDGKRASKSFNNFIREKATVGFQPGIKKVVTSLGIGLPAKDIIKTALLLTKLRN
jgi:hypothetical protein